MSEPAEYKIEETRTGNFIVSGPIIDTPSRFDNREQALSFCRYAIGGRSGFIRTVTVDGNSSRQLFQGSRHLTQDGAFQR